MECNFPFRKLRHYTFTTLDVLMYVKYEDVCELVFKINKEARKYIVNNFITVRNGFINDGLIDIVFENDKSKQFDNYAQLEKNYF